MESLRIQLYYAGMKFTPKKEPRLISQIITPSSFSHHSEIATSDRYYSVLNHIQSSLLPLATVSRIFFSSPAFNTKSFGCSSGMDTAESFFDIDLNNESLHRIVMEYFSFLWRSLDSNWPTLVQPTTPMVKESTWSWNSSNFRNGKMRKNILILGIMG